MKSGSFGKFLIASALTLAMAAGAGLLGCGSNSNPAAPGNAYAPPPAGSGMGLLAVSLNTVGSVNAPAAGSPAGMQPHGPGHTPLAAVWITFDSIRVYPACDDSAGDDTTGEGEDSTSAATRWNGLSFLHDDHDSTGGGDDSTHADCDYIEVLTDPITVNLAGLDTTLTELLGTLELPQGDYTHMALHVADGWVVTQAGDSVEADVPGNNDLLKVIFPFTVSDGQVTEIVIVFDLDKSVVEAPPGSGNFKIKPVLHGAWGSHDHEHDSQFGHDDGGNNGGMHGNGGGNGGGNGHQG